MKRFGFLEILLLFLTGLVVLGVFTLFLAIIYPDAAKSLLRDVQQNINKGDSPIVGVLGKIGERGSEGYNYRVKPMFEGLAKRFGRSRRQTAPKVATAEKPSFKAKECLRCHEDLFEQRGVTNIYIDHRLHEAADLVCADCHSDTKHPHPKRIKEEICLDCHKAKGAAVECDACHPPGSILDQAVIPEEKIEEFLQGSRVAVKSILPHNFATPEEKWLRGEGDSPCRNCHEVPVFCNRCHLVFHDEIPQWTQVHGPRLLRQEYVMNVCWTCHNPSWCAATCHSNPNNRQRMQSFLPLPIEPLGAYLD